MTRKNASYFISAIFVLAVLLILVIVFVLGAAEKNDLNLDLAFGGMVASMIAVALALVSIGHSIKEADVVVCLGEKRDSESGVWQEVRVRNRGNEMGNMASAFVEIEEPASAPVSFVGATGLEFVQTENPDRKQYRFDDPQNPRPLYPAEYIWSNLGCVVVPSSVTKPVRFSVQIVGTQGRKRKVFEISA